MRKLLDLLDKLDNNKIYYRLNRVNENILVEIAVPGERWEVEFGRDDFVQIEKFISTGRIHEESELSVLFQCFSD